MWIPALLGLSTTVALNGRLLPYGRHILAGAAAAAPGAAIVAVVTLLVYLSARRVRWAVAALIVVTAADLGAWGLGFIFRERPRTIAGLTFAVPSAPDSPAAYAAAPANGRYKANLLVLAGYRLTTGYVGLFPAAHKPLDSQDALRLTGTRWRFTEDGARHPFEGGLARVRLLDEQGRDATGIARLTVDRPGNLVVDVDAPGRRVLALTERFHDGWSASIDGVPRATMLVEEDFLGSIVDAGIHRVQLRFMPRSVVYGSIASTIGAVLLAGIIVMRLR